MRGVFQIMALHELYRKEKKKSILYSMYEVLSETPFIKRYFRRIKKRLKLLYPNDEYTINRMTVQIMLKGIFVIVPCIIAICLFFEGELFFIMTSLITIVIIFNNSINAGVNKLEYRLLNQLREFLDDVRHYYYETGMLDDSLFMAMDTVSHELGLHINYFYEIVTSVEAFSEVDKYTQISPNRFFLTFVSNCASIKEYGDNKVDGQSVFLRNLNYLKEAISDELLQIDLVKSLFSGLVFVCMLPVFLLKPLAMWGISIFPEMSKFYNGFSGTVFMGVIYAITLIVYEVIVSMQSDRINREDGGVLFDKLLENRIIKRFVVLHDNYNASMTEKIGDMLKATGSMIGTQKFFIKRVLIALLTGILVNVMSISAVHQTTKNLLLDFSNEFTSAFVPNEEYRRVMQEVSSEYVKTYKDDVPDERILTDKLVNEKGISEDYAVMIAQTVIKRICEINEHGYKWYIFLGSIICAVIGYYVPYILLIFKNKRAFMEQQNELEQFQTIALILMNMDGITINTILEWLSRFSFCFKEDIEGCILELEKSEEDALRKLRNNEYKPFKHFVDCLLAIDKVGVKLAFAEIEEERIYNKEKRKQDNRYMLDRKARMCKTIAFIPLHATVFGYLIIPFAMTAINMFSEFSIKI